MKRGDGSSPPPQNENDPNGPNDSNDPNDPNDPNNSNDSNVQRTNAYGISANGSPRRNIRAGAVSAATARCSAPPVSTLQMFIWAPPNWSLIV